MSRHDVRNRPNRQVVDHAVEYVRGLVHTNGAENFWSLTKWTLGGTYVSVESFHLFRYLDEQSFRFNHRGNRDNSDRFSLLCSQIVDKRLTHAGLTAKEDKTGSFLRPFLEVRSGRRLESLSLFSFVPHLGLGRLGFASTYFSIFCFAPFNLFVRYGKQTVYKVRKFFDTLRNVSFLTIAAC